MRLTCIRHLQFDTTHFFQLKSVPAEPWMLHLMGFYSRVNFNFWTPLIKIQYQHLEHHLVKILTGTANLAIFSALTDCFSWTVM